MISTSFRVALSAFVFAGALGLASTGAVQAQSIMKQCGDDWKAAKANNTTNGMKWPEFLKQCRDREGRRRGSGCSSRRRARRSAGCRSRAGPDANLSAEAEANVQASRSPDRRGPIQLGSAKPRRAAPPTPWSGSTPRASPTPIIIRAPAGTARPSRAPTCARPTLGPQATTRRRARRSSRSSSPEALGSQGRPMSRAGRERAARFLFEPPVVAVRAELLDRSGAWPAGRDASPENACG